MENDEAHILALVASLPEHILAEVKRTVVAKKMEARMVPFFEALSELAGSHNLLPGATHEQRRSAYGALVAHVERLWDDATSLFIQGSHSTAFFLAIVTLEELGKVSVAKVQASGATLPTTKGEGIGAARSALRSHPKKHVLAVAAGAVVNARLDRLVGIDRVLGFIEQAESGELERARQDCLYYDVRGGMQHLPCEAISPVEAELALVISGELLAEVGPLVPEEWRRLVAKVEAFEQAHTWLRNSAE